MKTTQELKELLYKNKTVADQQPDAIAEANACLLYTSIIYIFCFSAVQ